MPLLVRFIRQRNVSLTERLEFGEVLCRLVPLDKCDPLCDTFSRNQRVLHQLRELLSFEGSEYSMVLFASFV